MQPYAAMFFVTNFEETEAIAPLDILRRGGVDVLTVSLTGDLCVTSSHGLTVRTDALFEDFSPENAEMLILPGGPGTKNYLEHKPFLALLRDFFGGGKKIAAICAAPTILSELGFLENKKCVCYPGFKLKGAAMQEAPFVTDGNITTGKGAGCALEFGFELLRILRGADIADDIAEKMVFNGYRRNII